VGFFAYAGISKKGVQKMIGVTEERAKEIFMSLWSGDQFEWDFEREHFLDMCNRFGLDTVNDAKYQLTKARDDGKMIRDEMQYFWGCARAIKDRNQTRESSNAKHPRGDDGGITPQVFNSYREYYEHLKSNVQKDFPDTPEQATERERQWKEYLERRQVAKA
jgi:hypothetical protein